MHGRSNVAVEIERCADPGVAWEELVLGKLDKLERIAVWVSESSHNVSATWIRVRLGDEFDALALQLLIELPTVFHAQVDHNSVGFLAATTDLAVALDSELGPSRLGRREHHRLAAVFVNREAQRVAIERRQASSIFCKDHGNYPLDVGGVATLW